MNQNSLYENRLSETEVISLETILAANKPIVSPLALSLLKRDNPNYEYDEFIDDIEQNSARMIRPSKTSTTQIEGEEFKLYPNPSIDYTTLKYNCSYSNMNYMINEMQGRTLVQKPLLTIKDKNSNEVLIDLSSLSSGTYQIIIKTNETILWTEKLIITE